MHISRNEEYLLTSDKLPEDVSPERSSDARELAAFIADAKNGERLDPTNAYFATMLAIGLCMAKRDGESCGALVRASHLRGWDEYLIEDAASRLEIYSRLFGRDSALGRAVVDASVLYPHYAGFRALARVATYQAIQLERAGKHDRALAIRLAIVRIGDLLRARSTTAIGSLVGINIPAIALIRPGGGEATKKPEGLTSDEWVKHRQEQFYRYLAVKGKSEDSALVRAALDAGANSKAIVTDSYEWMPNGWAAIYRLIGLWWLGMILLVDASWFFAMSVGLSLVVRSRVKPAVLKCIVVVALIALGLPASRISQWLYELLRSYGITEFSYSVAIGLPATISVLSFIWAASRKRRAFDVLSKVYALCALAAMVAYAGVLSCTAVKEKSVSVGQEECARGEGTYVARLRGAKWPGPVF